MCSPASSFNTKPRNRLSSCVPGDKKGHSNIYSYKLTYNYKYDNMVSMTNTGQLIGYLYPLGTKQCFVLPHPSMENKQKEYHHGCVPGDNKGHSNIYSYTITHNYIILVYNSMCHCVCIIHRP